MPSVSRIRKILNEDLLHCALPFVSCQTLFTLTTVSSTVGAPATRFLYYRVILQTMSSFSRFHTTITSDKAHAQLRRDLVYHFVEQLDAALDEFAHTSFHKQLSQILGALPRLHTISLRTSHRLERHSCCKGLTILPMMSISTSQLRSLRLAELSNFDIDHFAHRNAPHLQHLYVSTLRKDMRRIFWGEKDTARLVLFVARHLPGLHSLVLPKTAMQKLIDEQHAKRQRWPNVQLLGTPQVDLELKQELEELAVGTSLLAVFPNLRSLEVHDYSPDLYDEGGIDVLVPSILHLTIVHNTVDKRILEDDHQIVSLELLASPGVPGRMNQLFGSPFVRHLHIGFRFDGGLRILLEIVRAQFPNLVSLEVWITTSTEEKLLNIAQTAPSASLPPQLISLTIRWSVKPKADLERSGFVRMLAANHRSLRVFRTVEAHPEAHMYTQPETERLERVLKLKRDGWVINRSLEGRGTAKNVGWQVACARALQLATNAGIDTPGWKELY